MFVLSNMANRMSIGVTLNLVAYRTIARFLLWSVDDVVTQGIPHQLVRNAGWIVARALLGGDEKGEESRLAKTYRYIPLSCRSFAIEVICAANSG